MIEEKSIGHHKTITIKIPEKLTKSLRLPKNYKNRFFLRFFSNLSFWVFDEFSPQTKFFIA